MDAVTSLIGGFAEIFTPVNLMAVIIGVVLGNLVGVLPGLGPTAAMSLLLPATMAMDATTAIVMLAGIYYGAMFGGAITSVLLNIPGEATAIATAFDGHPMARQGRAGAALAISAGSSFIGSMMAAVAIVLMASQLADLGLSLGPPEITCILFLALTLASSLSQGSLTKALLMTNVGLVLAMVGQDIFTGQYRLTFGSGVMRDGLDLAVVIMGLFGISEILMTLGEKHQRALPVGSLRAMLPTRTEMRQAGPGAARGGLVGMFLGLIPGAGGLLSSFAAYSLEKKVSRTPERFGKGAPEGVSATESANNSGALTAFLPMLTLGIPTTATTAILLGAFMMNGIQPGPMLFENEAPLAWGLIASMFLGTFILLILNIPLVRVWTWFLRVPFPVLYPILIALICVGAFSINNSVSDVAVVVVFGVLGYLARRHGYPLAPLALAFVIGGQLEAAFRQSLAIGGGSPLVFVTRPVSGLILAATAAATVVILTLKLRASRKRTTTPSPLEESNVEL
jgi:putative tricarboxylic transport membrane protein